MTLRRREGDTNYHQALPGLFVQEARSTGSKMSKTMDFHQQGGRGLLKLTINVGWKQHGQQLPSNLLPPHSIRNLQLGRHKFISLFFLLMLPVQNKLLTRFFFPSYISSIYFMQGTKSHKSGFQVLPEIGENLNLKLKTWPP